MMVKECEINPFFFLWALCLRVFAFKSRVSVLGVLGLLAVSPAFAQKINLPPITRATLPNGVRLVLMEYHKAPSITINCIFPGGSSVNPSSKAGVAEFTVELLRKGTAKRTAVQIAEEIDYLGGSLGGGATADRSSMGLFVLSKDADAGLDLLVDTLRHPTFPEEEVERVRRLALAELQALPEDPGTVAARVARETVFGSHPYSRQMTVSSVNAIKRDDLVNYHHEFISPDRMIVVAVGDFQASEMLVKLMSRFGDWQRVGGFLPSVPPVTSEARKLVLVDKPDATQSQVQFIRTAFKRNSANYFPALVVNTALGGGFTSRLVEEIRIARGLTYDISSAFSPMLRGGTFSVGTFTKIETTRKLLNSVDEVLRRTSGMGITAVELAKVKQYLAGTFAIRLQSGRAIADELGNMVFYGLPPTYLANYLANLKAVTLEQANHIAGTYFLPDALSIVMVAPAKAVTAQLGGLGNFEIKSVETVGK